MTEFQKNVPLKDYTTYKIGGPAKYFFVAKTKEDLISALQEAKKNKLKVLVLGGGSNLLVSDKGFPGLVVKIDIQEMKFEKNKLFTGAGVDLTKLVYESAEKGLSGLEWAAGIPGATVGGAIYGHAQAFGEKSSDVIKSVEALNLKTLKTKELCKRDCQFSLKNSVFKKNKNLIIVSAVLELREKDPAEIKKQIKENLDYRNTMHPMNFPSAGSTFVNPEVKIKDKKLLIKFPEILAYNKKGVIPAGFLIKSSGLGGKIIGNAQISEKHANFIINLGGARAKDVLRLIKLARQKVKETFNIDLEPEVQIIK